MGQLKVILTLMRWKNLVDYLEYADQVRTEKQNYKSHLGGNVYCIITEDSACMDIRQYWKPQEEVIPFEKGIIPETPRIHCRQRTLNRNWKGLTRTRRGRTLLRAK